MKKTLRNSLVAAVAGGAALALPALAFGVATGSGASFPATAYSKWCQDSGLCSYTSKGSTGGINDLINGVVDFAASDAPLTPQQTSDLAAKRGGVTPLYFPTLIGTITVDTNIDGVSKGINFDGKTLARHLPRRDLELERRPHPQAQPGRHLPERADHPLRAVGRVRARASTSPATCPR